jgi:hypothetical protein
MNGQNFGEHFNTSGLVEQADQDANSTVVNVDSTTEKVPVFAALIQQTPMNGTIPPVIPQDETIVQEAPMSQTIVYDQDSMGKTIEPEALTSETIPDIAPKVESNTEFPAPLLNPNESEHLRTRWNDIQGKFVDEPRSAVQQADELVSEVVEKITQMFSNEHSSLESQWKQGNDVSTEDLRKALQHYRFFFNRLVV